MTFRLRLVKVIVTPVFVLDDGDSLTEQPAQPVEVPAARWPRIVDDLEAERLAIEQHLNEPPAP